MSWKKVEKEKLLQNHPCQRAENRPWQQQGIGGVLHANIIYTDIFLREKEKPEHLDHPVFSYFKYSCDDND